MYICKEEHCTGCSACMNKCPKQCIEMKEDEIGHLHPYIDDSRCIECGLCRKVCPENTRPVGEPIRKVYAAWSLDDNDRQSSSSGGIASVLTNHIIYQGGKVFGAVSGNHCDVYHKGIDTISETVKFKGSKYVQSTIGYCYKEVKAALESNRKVLFIGTPCQIAGLRNYLGKSYDNLTMVDIICHGVPPIKLVREHLSKFCNIEDITKVTFRDNENYRLSAFRSNKLLYSKPFPKDSYMYGFMYGLFYRPSCYECRYANNLRVSDITIGDFWGLGKTKPVSYPTKKVSVVIPNTAKGIKMLSECHDYLFLEERDSEEAIAGNTQLQRPSKKHKYYNLFRKIYKNAWGGYLRAVRICMIEFHIKYTIHRLISKLKKRSVK